MEYIQNLNFYAADNIDAYGRDKVYCEESVILAGGAINSPQLLLVSGVGPGEELKVCSVLKSVLHTIRYL